MRAIRVVTISLALSLSGRLPALAGPSFQTDDPEPVDYQHFEAYVFSTYDGTKIGSAAQGPAFEVNWGVGSGCSTSLSGSAAAFTPKEGPSAFGIGDTEVGVKFRFIHEAKHRPEFRIFPFAELPTGSANATGISATTGISVSSAGDRN